MCAHLEIDSRCDRRSPLHTVSSASTCYFSASQLISASIGGDIALADIRMGTLCTCSPRTQM
jgi:hypothetical protein